MSVLYALVDNPLTKITTDFRASVRAGDSVTEEELFEMIVLQNTGITLSVARKVHTEYLKALRFFLQKGRHINTPLFNSTYSISGVFDNDEDSFDPSRHQLNLNLLPGVGIKDVVEQVSVTKVEASTTLPLISTYFDIESGTKNERLTPGELGRISGKRLKFDATDEAQGVFFINAQNKAVKVSKLAECQPSKIIFKVPEKLSSGAYSLEVRTDRGKIGVLSSALIVK